MRTETRELRSENSVLTTSGARFEDRVTALQSQIETCEQLAADEKERYTQLEGDYTKLASILLRTEVQRYTAGGAADKAEEIMGNLADLQDQVTGLETEKTTLEREMSAKDAQIESLEGKHDALAADKEALEGKVADLRQELLERTRELKELTMEHEALHRDRERTRDQNARLDAVINDRDAQIEVCWALRALRCACADVWSRSCVGVLMGRGLLTARKWTLCGTPCRAPRLIISGQCLISSTRCDSYRSRLALSPQSYIHMSSFRTGWQRKPVFGPVSSFGAAPAAGRQRSGTAARGGCLPESGRAAVQGSVCGHPYA